MVATHRTFPYAAVLAAALALASCSGADQAPAETLQAPTVTTTSSSAPSPTSGTPSTSASPTQTEDPVLAKIPKEARAETPQGAEAFVKFYFAQLNSAFREADPRIVEGLASRKCIVCNAMWEGVRDVRSKKQHYDSDLITVQSAIVMDFASDSRKVLAQVRQNPVKVLDSQGDVVERAPSGAGNYVFTLNFGPHWQVARLQEAQ